MIFMKLKDRVTQERKKIAAVKDKENRKEYTKRIPCNIIERNERCI